MKVLKVDNTHFIGMYLHFTVTYQTGVLWWKKVHQINAFKNGGNWRWADSAGYVHNAMFREALDTAFVRREYLINIGQKGDKVC